jgi:DNA-binding SARP family transcriptional activator
MSFHSDPTTRVASGSEPIPGPFGRLPMSKLRIRLFGSAELERNSEPLAVFPTRKSHQLFSFLVLNRERPYPRDVLIGALWGEQREEAARKCLRTELWRLRALVESADPGDEPTLAVRGHTVAFNRHSDYWLDVEEFERRVAAVAEPVDAEGAALLREAVDLYRSDLLEEVYDDWCVTDRERLRLMYLGALERLMGFHDARREWDAAIELGHRFLHVDPLAEQVHRELMRCYVRQGNRSAALRQFADCEQMLRAEFGSEPMEETLLLAAQIRSGGTSSRERGGPLAETADALRTVHRLLQDVDTTLAEIHTATRQLEQARSMLVESLAAAHRAPPRGPKRF